MSRSEATADTADAAALTAWGPSVRERLGRDTVTAPHRLADLACFSDAGLAEALDAHPRGDLQVFTMGTDPARPDEWQPVEPGDASGTALLEAVRRGRLWLNVLRIDRSSAPFADLQDRLFAEIARGLPDFEPDSCRSTLLVSSPGAQVYFHVDAGPNILWQVRGTKRVWVYPARDPSLVSPTLLADIYAGVRTENLPYRPEFDRTATDYRLVPGQTIAWAQNAPHRVQNVAGVNVSLSCEFATAASRRREYTVLANRWLERSLHAHRPSEREDGPRAALKRIAYRMARKVRVERTRPHYEYRTDLRVDAAAPTGVRRLDTPVLTAFSVE